MQRVVDEASGLKFRACLREPVQVLFRSFADQAMGQRAFLFVNERTDQRIPADDSQVSVTIRNTGAAQMDAELLRVSGIAGSDEPMPGISSRAYMKWRAAPLPIRS